jgi:two-component system chemotaxis response regulator CheY
VGRAKRKDVRGSRRPADAGGGASAPAAARARILLVDDDAGHRAALKIALLDDGYEIAEAEDGRAAIDYLLANPAPSVVLLDLLMAGVSGWEVLSVLRSYIRLRRIPVIVITGEPARLQVPGVGVVAQIQKPIRLLELLELLRRYI